MQQIFHAKKTTLAIAISLALSAGLTACGGDDDGAVVDSGIDNTKAQPALSVKGTKKIITVDGKNFKDLNANDQLDKYEDWRRTIDQRVDDLVSKMTLEEKAGLMLIDTLNSGCGGAVTPTGFDYINTQKMHRFIFRNVVNATAACTTSSATVTPKEAAQFTNAVQAMNENTRLGIPALFKSNARNHYEKDPRFGISEAAGAFTEFPKEAGIAAAALGSGDMSLVKTFSQVMGDEWKSIGLRGMYGYMADLSTEPRWYRVHETFTEDADLNSNIMKTLVETLQGGPLNPSSPVALTMKHFPGGGPQEQGFDPHYAHGKNQTYDGGNFEYHLKPFMAAINAGVSSIMPYYGVPIKLTYQGVTYDEVGMAFSKQIVTDLLRGKLGFKGYVNSDTGIINDRAWGLEKASVPERVAAAINGGTDTLSGFHDVKTILDLTKTNGADGKPLLSEARITEAAKRLLKAQFELGLFENPYVDDSKPVGIIGSDANRDKGMDIQRKSIVLLQNQDAAGGGKVLPLKAGAKVYTMGIATSDTTKYGYTVTNGETTTAGVDLKKDLVTGNVIGRPSAAGNDYAVIRVEVSNNKIDPATGKKYTTGYKSDDPATGGLINPLTGKTWGAQDRCVAKTPLYSAEDAAKSCLDNGLGFGGAFPWEANNLSFTKMAESQSWQISPSLADIQAVMNEVGAAKTVLSIYFRQPYVLDDASGLKNAGAIVAGFGVSNTALLDTLSGKVLKTGAAFKPQGKMPFALAKTQQAVIDQKSDLPGYKETKDGELFPFAFGLTY